MRKDEKISWIQVRDPYIWAKKKSMFENVLNISLTLSKQDIYDKLSSSYYLNI